jgi:ketosteroid isomerase-like protein
VSQNTDTIRQGTDAFNAFMRGELSNEALAEGVDPQIELLWRDRQTYPDFPQHLQGTAEFIALFEQVRDGWIDLVYELLELIKVPDGRVVALVRQSGRGRQSGVPIVVHFFELCTFRDGKVRKMEFFRHRADAFQAAGLLEWPISGGSTTPDLAALTRSTLEAVNRRDFDAMLGYAAPDVVYDTTPSGFGLYEGVPAIREFIEGYWKTFDELRFDLEEFQDLGNCVTFAVNRQQALPVGSTAPIEAREAHVTEWKDGFVVRITVYTDIDEGRAAAERLARERE